MDQMQEIDPRSPAALRAKLARKDEPRPKVAADDPPPAPLAPEVNPKKAEREARRAATPQIKFLCGHTRPITDVQNRNCPECRNRAIHANNQKKREAQAKRPKKFAEDRGRLPDAARFAVAYDATAHAWSGKLTIGETEFIGENSAVEKLLRDLASQYWDSIKKAD